MNDIYEQLRYSEAAAEIERLLKVCKDKSELLWDAYAGNERRDAEIERLRRLLEMSYPDQQAEIERLREALKTIALWYIDYPRDAEDMAKYASEALGRDPVPVGRKKG